MKFELEIFKPKCNKPNHLLILLNSAKVVDRIFKIDIFAIDAIGLRLGKFGVIRLNDVNNIGHTLFQPTFRSYFTEKSI